MHGPLPNSHGVHILFKCSGDVTEKAISCAIEQIPMLEVIKDAL